MLLDTLESVPDKAVGVHLFWLAEKLGRNIFPLHYRYDLQAAGSQASGSVLHVLFFSKPLSLPRYWVTSLILLSRHDKHINSC